MSPNRERSRPGNASRRAFIESRAICILKNVTNRLCKYLEVVDTVASVLFCNYRPPVVAMWLTPATTSLCATKRSAGILM
jgi:hypothetical protein